MPAWFGRSTLTWWAMAGSRGLVSAPSAPELAGLLYRLLGTQADGRPVAPKAVMQTRAVPALVSAVLYQPRSYPQEGQVTRAVTRDSTV